MPVYGRVAPPTPTPPRVGLLASLGGAARIEEATRNRPGDERTRWELGYAYTALPCDGSDAYDGCNPGTLTYSADSDLVEVAPFVVTATAECSTFDSLEDRNARARQSLAACESKQIASELWTGTLARAATPDWSTPYLASSASDELSLTPAGFSESLACLEQYLAQCACGGRGMIHATRQLGTHWNALGLLRREGNVVLTVNDTLVVLDAGYDGSGPQQQPAEDGSVWAYASSMVDVRLAPVEVIGGDLSGVDRTLNLISVRAQRTAAYDFNPCCLGAIAVDLNLCDVGPPGS